MSTYRETKYIAKNELKPTKVNPTAAPFKPKERLKKGTKIQVSTVHIIINLNVKDIFPIALRVLVKGVVMAARAEVTLNIVRAKSAPSHLLYFGIICTSDGAIITSSTSDGNTSKQTKLIAFETAFDSSRRLSCNLEKAGKVTLIT